jgi:hypothetical protein
MRGEDLMARVPIPLIVMLLVVPGWTHAAPADLREPPFASRAATDREASIEKILVVLVHEVTEPASRTKAKEKLATLSDGRLRLMAALSDRVALAADGPADGIALFLITALLILS